MAKEIKKYSQSALILALIVAIVGVYFSLGTAKAAYLTNEKDTLSESRPGFVADHTIVFTVATNLTASSTIKITFDAANDGFDLTGFANTEPEDFDIASTSEYNIVASSGCDAAYNTIRVKTVQAGDNDYIEFQTCEGANTIAAGTTLTIEIGTNATTGPGSPGNDQIDNATAGAKNIDIEATPYGGSADTGRAMVAIIEGVAVSAIVSETLSVTVNGTTTCTVSGGTDIGGTASNAIGYGTVTTTEAFYNGCQDIRISTNASQGYTATVHKTQLLTSGAYTIPDTLCNNSPACSVGTAETWDNAQNNGFGYCMDDWLLDAAGVADDEWQTNPCGGSQQFKQIPTGSASAANFMRSSTATSTNAAYAGYRLSVDGAQAAGNYETVIVYIVTPTY